MSKRSRYVALEGHQVYIFARPEEGAPGFNFHILTVTEETLHVAALFAWLAHVFALPMQRPAL